MFSPFTLLLLCIYIYIYIYVYIFFSFFTAESTLNDGAGCGSIRWPHIRMPLLFLAVLHEKKKKAESSVIDFFFFPCLAFRLLFHWFLWERAERNEGSYTCGCRTSVSLSGCCVLACRALSPGMCRWDNQVQQARGGLLQWEITCSEAAVKDSPPPRRHLL